MRKRHSNEKGGSTLIEFVFVGVPLIFLLVSILAMGQVMWNYHSVNYAINSAARYVIVRGKNCGSCATVSGIANYIKSQGIGLSDSSFNVTLTSASGSAVTCNPLNTCYSNNSAWPSPPDNAPGSDVSISGKYTAKTPLSMFWPHAGKPQGFGGIYLVASSKQIIQY
jgi:Flp pilus assembly protein TadG